MYHILSIPNSLNCYHISKMYAQVCKNINKGFDKVIVGTSTTVGLKLNHASIRTCFTKTLPVGWSYFSVPCKDNTQMYHYWLPPCGNKFNSFVNIWRFLSGEECSYYTKVTQKTNKKDADVARKGGSKMVFKRKKKLNVFRLTFG